MKTWKIIAGIAGLGAVTYVALPKVLNRLGLHPHYKGRRYNLVGKRALVITTSHDTLGETGKATGVVCFRDDVALLRVPGRQHAGRCGQHQGRRDSHRAQCPCVGRWPCRPTSATSPTRICRKRCSTRSRSTTSISPSTTWSIMAGGWGAAYDLGTSEVLGRKISEAYAAGAVLGSVCHGALGFLQATDEDGEPLLKGRHATGVSDKQVRELGITITPQHPETELRKIGAIYESNTAFRDMFANLTVVDGRIVTGQNQNAGSETAQKMMAVLVSASPGVRDGA